MVILLGARASRVENQDAIDACIVGMLADPKEVMKYKIIYKCKMIFTKQSHYYFNVGKSRDHRGTFSAI